jgi:hypothetical protein
MTSTRKLFTSVIKQVSRVHVELGNDAKYALKGVGTILFHLESSRSLEVTDVMYVSGLKMFMLLVSFVEDKGFVVEFRKGKALIKPKGSSLDTA